MAARVLARAKTREIDVDKDHAFFAYNNRSLLRDNNTGATSTYYSSQVTKLQDIMETLPLNCLPCGSHPTCIAPSRYLEFGGPVFGIPPSSGPQILVFVIHPPIHPFSVPPPCFVHSLSARTFALAPSIRDATNFIYISNSEKCDHTNAVF